MRLSALVSRSLVAVFCVLGVFTAQSVSTSPTKPEPRFSPNTLLVKYRSDVAARSVDGLARGQGAIAVRSFRQPRQVQRNLMDQWRQVTLAPGTEVREALARFRDDPAVEWAEPDYIWTINALPNDAGFSQLWGLHNLGQTGGANDADIDAAEAWDLQTNGSSIIVGVIDSGIAYNHPDLAANVWTNPGEIAGNGLDDDGNGYIDDIHGYDFINNDADPFDDNGHGTHCSGTIGGVGNNGIGVAGVSWNARIMGLKFLGANGTGPTTAAVDAVLYGSAMGARVLSNSWGGGGFSLALQDAIRTADARGTLFVAAAGNSNADNDLVSAYPANFPVPNVVSVAATDHSDLKWAGSSYGLKSVHLGAPGAAIYSTVPFATNATGYATFSGTSMATPHVSGAAALIFSRFPGITHLQVKQRLVGSADPIAALAGRTISGGRLNAFAALENDAIAPSPIVNLTVTATGARSATLSWTNTGDDGTTGTAQRLDIRYATSPITDQSFANASPAPIVPKPLASGSSQSVTITGLRSMQTYYFAAKVLDNVGNSSGLSNVTTTTTGAATIVFSDNLENGTGNWTVAGTDGRGGPSLWHLSSRRYASPSKSFYYGMESTGNYDTGFRNAGTLTSAPIDLRCFDEPHVTLSQFVRTENFGPYEVPLLSVSKDGGATWTVVRQFPNTTSLSLVEETVDLTGFAREVVQLRFSLDTVDNLFNTLEGWYVDDIKVLGTPASNAAPKANPGARYTGLAGAPIAFNGGGSSDCNANPLTFAWDFGDGATDTGINPSHTYSTPGIYTVTLSVTSSTGTGVARTRAYVGVLTTWTNAVGVTTGLGSLTRNADPAGWTSGAASTNQALSGDALVEFTAAATNTYTMLGFSNGDSGQAFADIDFAIYPAANGELYVFESGVSRGLQGTYMVGDRLGVEIRSGTVLYLKNGQTLYSNTLPGLKYPLRVDTSLYSPGAVLSNVTVYGTLPTNLAPTASAGNGYRWTAGLPISFLGSGSDSDGMVTGYSWDFGDGTTGTGAALNHVYASAGEYTATLTVTDNGGATGSASVTVVVSPAVPTLSVPWKNVVGVTATAGSLVKTEAVGWNGGAASSKAILSGNGYVETTIAETNTFRVFGLSNGDSGPSYTDIDFGFYPAANGLLYVYESGTPRGPYGVYDSGDRLRVSVDGAVVRYVRNGRVIATSVAGPRYPLLVDTALYSTGATLSNVLLAGSTDALPFASTGTYEDHVGVPIQFTGAASSDPDGFIVSYSWSFGDGTAPASGISPSHTYAAAGNYIASLTVTDNDGHSRTSTTTVRIDGFNVAPVNWTNAVGVEFSFGSIMKISETTGWDSGASSMQSIGSGDGFVTATVNATNTFRLFGLSSGNTDASYNDVDFAFYPAGDGNLYILEKGINRGNYGPYAVDDRLRVSVRAGAVRYIRNGRVLVTSPTPITYPLGVDSSFYSFEAGLDSVVFGTP
jgi:subtilisin family serine protease/PKD repeat protein